MKSWMPWVLVAALAGGVAFAVFSPSVPDRMTAAPAQPAAAAMPQSDDEPPSTGMGGAMPGMAPPSEPAPPETSLTGVVKEHMDVSQYTYLRLATDAGETWAAVYRAPVKTGATVTVERASAIHGFHSTELAKDFPEIWFGMLPGYENAPAASGSAVAAPARTGDAGRPAGAITIAELAKGAATLEGKEVTVAGKVVKENEGILGRNWIHLQDGTGSASDGTNDILVTSDSSAKVGDALVATGTVRTNQDFGSGYAYKFMIEKAALRVSP